VDRATEELVGFYRNYHSLRYVGNRLVLRLRARPTDEEVAALSEEFGSLSTTGRIETTDPLPAEVADDDHLDLHRLVLRFDRTQYSGLRRLIDAINKLPSAPEAESAPPLERQH
jgi:hypothetical protein